MATTDTTALPRVPWDDAMRAMNWQQGQHVLFIGPTGRGKTEALIRVLEPIQWGIFLATKRRDETIGRLKKLGYKTIRDPAQIEPQIYSRIILRPKWPRVDADEIRRIHHRIFKAGLNRAFQQENWAIGMDEARYICDQLKLSSTVTNLLIQGRSQGNSVIAATQRPRFIPLEFYDQSDHFFIWRDNDRGNTRRVMEMLGQHADALTALEAADFHDVLYVNDRTGKAMLTNTRWET
jgi:hypothetical protein